MFKSRLVEALCLLAVLSLFAATANTFAQQASGSDLGSDPGRRGVTFNRDVAPIVFQHCTSCHRPGEAAPFPLQTFEEVHQRAALIASVTERRFMPPWKPDPDFGEFEGVRRLTDDQIHTIQQWVEDGATEGDPRDLPHVPGYTGGWQLGPPDLVVAMPEAFAMPANGPDVFRNFVLTVPLKTRRFVRAVEFRPAGAKAIHHARIMIDETQESRWRDSQDPDTGFGGMHAPGAKFPDGHFLGWAAGKSPTVQSITWPLDAGSDLVIQMHLKPTGRAESIRAMIGLYFSNNPPSASPVMVRLGSQTIDIPAGNPAYVVTDEYELPVDAQALRIYPHAHYLGKEITVTARTPDGRTERLLHITDWDFNWQDDYEYANPVTLPRGSTIAMRFVYDNTAANPRNPNTPPARVQFGPLAANEMGEVLVQLVPKRPADVGTLRASAARKALLEDIAGEEKKIAEEPDDVDGRNSLAVHYMQTGRTDEAVSQLQAALGTSPDHAITNYNLAVISMTHQQPEQADAHFRRALQSRPNFPEAQTNFGVLLLRKGQTDAAIKQFRAALAIKPGNVIARSNLGHALLKEDRPEDAVLEFQELVRAQPENPVALDALATAYAASGDFAQAIRVGQHALTRATAMKDEQFARTIRQRLLMFHQQGEAAPPR
jgi:Tfp pilus assembly protein PilF